jgi:UDP-2-acetamido-2,6-beta-L-arabino-hexul-4-ose reductase
MYKIGITGQTGFVGTHLFDALRKKPSIFEVLPFEDDYFSDVSVLSNYVGQCDIIVHLAAIMRHPVKGEVYNIDMKLTNDLLKAIQLSGNTPSLVFASSIQENDGTEYGQYKYESRLLLEDWARTHNVGCSTFSFVNMFGPLAKPNYSSFIATFCYKLTHGESPQVLVDKIVPLRYVDDVMEEIIPIILQSHLAKDIKVFQIAPEWRVKVSTILSILERFKYTYFDNNIIPTFCDKLDTKLFETFKSYMD